MDPDQCVALGAALAGVFRHRPDQVDQLVLPDTVQPTPVTRQAPSPKESEGAQIQLEVSQEPNPTATPVPGINREDITIQDATTHPLGIIVLDGQRQERVVELIPEGTKLPMNIVDDSHTRMKTCARYAWKSRKVLAAPGKRS